MALSLFHLHGDLKDLRIPRLLAALREDDFTGVFQATTRPPGAGAPPSDDDASETTREIHFSGGHIAWAISTDREESLKAYLLRNGALTEAQWAEAETRARETTLRDALTGLGFVGARELMQIEKGRAEEIVQALFSARDGEYRVRERQLAPGTPDLGIDPRPLILKGVLELGDRALVLDEIGSLDTVFVVKRSVLEEPGFALPGEFQSVLRHMDGKRSVAQVCTLTTLPDYFVSSVVAALSMVGAVKRNYARSQPRGRVEIVKGAEVATTPPPAARPAGPREPAAAPGKPTVQLDLPPITTTPFPGEGPVSPLDPDTGDIYEELAPDTDDHDAVAETGEPGEAAFESAAEDDVETGPDATDGTGEPIDADEAPAVAPEAAEAPRAARRSADPVPLLLREEPSRESFTRSIYDDDAPDDTSRPWFLIGGALAVGVAALFLILMAQGPGDAGEMAGEPGAVAGSLAPGPGADDDTGDSGAAEIPETPEIPAAPRPPVVEPAPSLAESPGSAMLDAEPSTPDGGRQSLIAGDYRAAARQFGREVSRGSGDYTIQLLTACQDQTVKRAVDSAGASPQLFILSTIVEGRNCYRVYWGRYPSQRKAQEALRHDVPSPFRQQRSQPRITRLAGS